MRGATNGKPVQLLLTLFQSTHPVRGATRMWTDLPDWMDISIHAPRAGCDWPWTTLPAPLPPYFNPRTPCGVRQGVRQMEQKQVKISIHAPRAGCDAAAFVQTLLEKEISIHAPRAGCDSNWRYEVVRVGYFNPRTPCGVRPWGKSPVHPSNRFQSTHPVRGATLNDAPAVFGFRISIHAPRAGCDVSWPRKTWPR